MNENFNTFELLVLSGKGGTGKTSITASLATLAKDAVLVDCDVDASNLELLLSPSLRKKEPYLGSMQARVNADLCDNCGMCMELCRFGAILSDGPANAKVEHTHRVSPTSCEGCAVCAQFCPHSAIDMVPVVGGEWYVSDTMQGPLVHARLQPGLGNSGKLTTLIRDKARMLARECGRTFMLLDGPPGIGCPVIASLTGTKQILVVTEPTPSGAHDLERVLELAKHFKIPTWVCVNKFDLNMDATASIEARATELGATIVGRIPYDNSVTEAQKQGLPVISMRASPAARAIQELWSKISPFLPEQSN
ncbi:MAG: 4Fe-4S binding protein [Opitutales bacterium]|nr:4Fe-4S binding protein [Opitutales bacterium]